MLKIINTLLVAVLLTACSAEDNNDTTEKNSTKIKENIAQIAIEKKENNTTETKKITKEKSSLFEIRTVEGKTIHIDESEGGLLFKEYKNKAVLLLFFGHRCPPCLAEIPVLKALINKGHKDLEIIAIEVQGYSKEQLKAFKEQKGINYTLVANIGNSNFINYIAQQSRWSGAIPFLIGFDKNSVVQVIHAGGLGEKDFDSIYDTLTKEK